MATLERPLFSATVGRLLIALSFTCVLSESSPARYRPAGRRPGTRASRRARLLRSSTARGPAASIQSINPLNSQPLVRFLGGNRHIPGGRRIVVTSLPHVARASSSRISTESVPKHALATPALLGPPKPLFRSIRSGGYSFIRRRQRVGSNPPPIAASLGGLTSYRRARWVGLLRWSDRCTPNRAAPGSKRATTRDYLRCGAGRKVARAFARIVPLAGPARLSRDRGLNRSQARKLADDADQLAQVAGILVQHAGGPVREHRPLSGGEFLGRHDYHRDAPPHGVGV